MDSERFDRLAKTLSGAISRRGALGALAGLAGLAGIEDGAAARKRRRGAKGQKGRSVAAEATCASPGPSANLSNCNFNGDDFSGDDLSGSRMVGTKFRNATLVGTNLSSSNMKDANFRGANLTCANLRSSTLKQADFRGFAGAGGAITDLTGANLSSSACGGIRVNTRTRFCRTRLCNGAISDADCPGGFDPDAFCCGDEDCPGGRSCVDNQCEVCDAVNCPNGCCTPEGECRVDSALACGGMGGAACGPACADNEACVGGACVDCATACPDEDCARCARLVDGSTICGGPSNGVIACAEICTSSTPCAIGRCILSDTSKATGAVTEWGPDRCGLPEGTAVCGGLENC
jgi:hypothetical protein